MNISMEGAYGPFRAWIAKNDDYMRVIRINMRLRIASKLNRWTDLLNGIVE